MNNKGIIGIVAVILGIVAFVQKQLLTEANQ